MTCKEFNEKWNDESYAKMVEERDSMANMFDKISDEWKEYINDCFDMYETEGFADTFKSPYEQFSFLNGKNFKVVCRCKPETDSWDWGTLPAWIIEFEDGQRIEALPEEISMIER